MSSNIAVAVTANVADLTAKRAVMSAELKAATKDLNDFAKTAATGGGTKELSAQMLAAAENVAKLKSQIASVDGQMRGFKGPVDEAKFSIKELSETVAS